MDLIRNDKTLEAKSYNTRMANLRPDTDYGYSTGDGIGNNLIFLDLNASYRLKNNLFVDLKHIYRKLDNDNSPNSTQFSSLSSV